MWVELERFAAGAGDERGVLGDDPDLASDLDASPGLADRVGGVGLIIAGCGGWVSAGDGSLKITDNVRNPW